MKKIGILTLVALFALSFTAFSQPQRPNRNGQPASRGVNWTPEQRAENLTKELNLTDIQKSSLVDFYKKQDKIREENRAEREKQRDQVMKDREKTREEYRAEREKELALQDAELEKIIGKEKMDEHKKIRQQRLDRMNENRRERPDMGRRGNRDQKNDSLPPVREKGKKKNRLCTTDESMIYNLIREKREATQILSCFSFFIYLYSVLT